MKFILLVISLTIASLSSSVLYADIATANQKATSTTNEVIANIKSIASQIPTKIVHFNVIPATVAARSWLKMLDKNQYGRCWEESSVLVKQNLSKESFIKAATRSRQPLGTFIKRNIIMSEPKTKLPGAPAGKYVLIKFESEFSNKKKVSQTVIIQQDPDQVWRVGAYFAM